MEYPKNSIYQHFALTLVILSLFGCTSIAIESKKNSNEVPSINENFKIEGKFKLSFMDSKETGYFELDKYNNTISLTLGKSFLLPEEVLILDIRDNLDLNKFALNQDYLNEIPSISIKMVPKSQVRLMVARMSLLSVNATTQMIVLQMLVLQKWIM